MRILDALIDLIYPPGPGDPPVSPRLRLWLLLLAVLALTLIYFIGR